MGFKKFLLYLLLLLLILAATAAAGYYFYYLPQQQEEEETTPEETTPSEQAPATQEFEGQYVHGELPEGWEVVEYQNGAGSDMLVSGVTYVGLTGLEVKNPDGTVVFKIKGVYGIGGLGICQNYFQFSDDSATYLSQIQTTNSEVGEAAPTIVDLTSTTYQEYELFGVRVRRIGQDLYWDKVSGDTYFQAACGISERIFNFTAPTFTGDSMAIDSYRFTINETSPESDLLTLDEILQSLTTP